MNGILYMYLRRTDVVFRLNTYNSQRLEEMKSLKKIVLKQLFSSLFFIS